MSETENETRATLELLAEESLEAFVDRVIRRANHAEAEVARLREAVEAALSDRITLSLPTADWAIVEGRPYASVNPDWLRAIVAEARGVRAALAPVEPSGEAESGEARSAAQENYDRAHSASDHHCVSDPCPWHPGETRIYPQPMYAAAMATTVPAPVPSGGQADGEARDIEALIEASSLGTPEAKALRASVSDEQVAAVMARAKELREQADGEGEVERVSVAGYLRATAAWCDSQDTSPSSADLRAIAGMVDAGDLAARPVLSREALRERMRGHWPASSRRGGSTCECGKGGSARGYVDHLADVLAGEQR